MHKSYWRSLSRQSESFQCPTLQRWTRADYPMPGMATGVMLCTRVMASLVRTLTLLKCWKELALHFWDQSLIPCACSVASMMQGHLHRMQMCQFWQVRLQPEAASLSAIAAACPVYVAHPWQPDALCTASAVSFAAITLHPQRQRGHTLSHTQASNSIAAWLHEQKGTRNTI